MGRRPRPRTLVLTAAIALAVLPAGARAADVTVGQTAPPGGALPDCSNASHHLQATVASGPSYVVASTGTITSWSHLGRTPTAGSGVLLVLRAISAPNAFQVVGRSPATEFTPGVLGTYPVQIPVQGGDQIGLRTIADVGCFFQTGDAGDTMRHTTTGQPDPMTGSVIEFLPDLLPQDRVNVSAVLSTDPGGGGGGGGPQRAERRIAGFGYSRSQDDFKGKLSSSAPECRKGKVTVFRRKGGPDRKIGSDTADAQGRWAVGEKDPAEGAYYAKVGETSTADVICGGAKSSTLRLN